MFQPAYSVKEWFAKRMMRPAFKRQIRKSWKVVSLGGRLGEILKANGAEVGQVVVLPNGVDGVWFDRPPAVSKSDVIRFLLVGRNEYRKGFHILEKALSMLKKPIQLDFVGDWPRLKSTHHNLTYHGVIRDKQQMMDVMDSCHVLLLPSLSEGMPTVVLEAKARGLAIIATDVGAVSELQSDLIEAGNAIQLAQRISSVVLAPESRLREHYKWSQVAESTKSEMVD